MSSTYLAFRTYNRRRKEASRVRVTQSSRDSLRPRALLDEELVKMDRTPWVGPWPVTGKQSRAPFCLPPEPAVAHAEEEEETGFLGHEIELRFSSYN